MADESRTPATGVLTTDGVVPPLAGSCTPATGALTMAGVALPLVRGLRPHVAALTASGRTPTVAQIVGAVLVGAATLEVLAEAAAPTTSTLLHSRMVYRKVDAVFAHMRVIRAREASTFVHSRVIRGRAEGADLLHVRVIRDRAWLPLWDDDIQRPIGRAVLTR